MPHWWVLPVAGTVVGYVTNWLAIWMIFEPVEPRRIGRWTLHGLFLKRQQQVADVYAEIIADDIVTVGNIGEELLHGPRADRTRAMIESSLRPAVDRATGRRAAARAPGGGPDGVRRDPRVDGHRGRGLHDHPADRPRLQPRSRASRCASLIAERMREMSSPDFSEMLRSAMREDEWLLVLHGAVLGFGAGLVHLAIFGV